MRFLLLTLLLPAPLLAAAQPPEATPDVARPMNILLLGVDARPGEAIDAIGGNEFPLGEIERMRR